MKNSDNKINEIYKFVIKSLIERKVNTFVIGLSNEI